MTIYRFTATWTGFTGAPGYTRLYASSLVVKQNFLDAMRTMFQAITVDLPNPVNISFDPNVRQIDEVTGQAQGEEAITAPAVVDGTGAVSYSAPSGAGISWQTNDFTAKNHRIYGRSFLIPLGNNVYDTDGTIAPAVVTRIQNAASAFLAGGGTTLVVWKRPVNGAGGSTHAVTSAKVFDKAYILKSRRD